MANIDSLESEKVKIIQGLKPSEMEAYQKNLINNLYEAFLEGNNSKGIASINAIEEATKLYEEKGFSNAYTIELGLRLDKANECLIKTLEEKSEVANFLTNEIIKNLLNNQMELILFSNCILNILIASYEKEPSENLLGTVKAVHEVINLELIFLKSLLERSFLYDREDYSEKVAIIEEAYSTYEKLASKIESL